MIIYQMLPRLWGDGTLGSIDEASFEHFRSLGITHVWYTGIIRHSTARPYVKGNPGSPFSITDYYDVNPYLSADPQARMAEFESLVERTHAAGMKVIIDFIPNHVSPDYSDAHGGLSTFDHYDWDWTDTRKINYGIRSNWDKLLAVLKFWISKGVDGFRCDMVELVPEEFFRWVIAQIKRTSPAVFFIAEIYDRNNYRRYAREIGFDYLYDKSGLYDVLKALSEGQGNAREITWNWQFLQDLQPQMLNFIENHDEPRMPGAYSALFVSLLINGAPFMLYSGQEVGETASDEPGHRTSIFDSKQPESLGHLYEYIHTGSGLSLYEDETLARFRKLLGTAPDWGTAYDLCYCNMDSPGFDPARHYIWTRYSPHGTYLLGANFTKETANISVFIPGYISRVNLMLPPCGGNIVRI